MNYQVFQNQIFIWNYIVKKHVCAQVEDEIWLNMSTKCGKTNLFRKHFNPGSLGPFQLSNAKPYICLSNFYNFNWRWAYQLMLMYMYRPSSPLPKHVFKLIRNSQCYHGNQLYGYTPSVKETIEMYAIYFNSSEYYIYSTTALTTIVLYCVVDLVQSIFMFKWAYSNNIVPYIKYVCNQDMHH